MRDSEVCIRRIFTILSGHGWRFINGIEATKLMQVDTWWCCASEFHSYVTLYRNYLFSGCKV